VKVIRKLTKAIQELQKAKFSSQLTKTIEHDHSTAAPEPRSTEKLPTVSLKKTSEVKAKGDLPQVPEILKEQQRELIDSLDLNQ
jgi:UDP-N-acetylglucosamine pyrophosphorylase